MLVQRIVQNQHSNQSKLEVSLVDQQLHLRRTYLVILHIDLACEAALLYNKSYWMEGRKKVLLIGANGFIGQELTKGLIKHFHVRALIRSAPKFGINSIFLKFVDGDATNEGVLETNLEGIDIVVSAFGVPIDDPNGRTTAFAKTLIEAMTKKVKRFFRFRELRGWFGLEVLVVSIRRPGNHFGNRLAILNSTKKSRKITITDTRRSRHLAWTGPFCALRR